MEPTVINTEPQQNRHTIRKVIIILVVLAAIAGITVLIVNVVHHNNLVNDVKNEVIKQNKLIKGAAKNNVYSTEIPVGVKSTKTVTINATISASGTDYCIAGTNKQDAKIVFHMSKATPEDAPDTGNCTQDAAAPPLVPTGFAIGSVGAGAISMLWSAAPFAASYTVQCATDKDFIGDFTSQTTSKTQVTISNLKGGTQYYCRVSATNSAGASLWSPTIPALTNVISVAPIGLTVTTVSNSDLHYSWSPVPGATAYVIEWSTDDDFDSNVVSVTTTATSGEAQNLKTYTGYYFHVNAVTSQFAADRAAFSGEVIGRTAK